MCISFKGLAFFSYLNLHLPLFIYRYWAVAVPAYVFVCVWVFIVLYLGVNFLLGPSLSDPRTVQGVGGGVQGWGSRTTHRPVAFCECNLKIFATTT